MLDVMGRPPTQVSVALVGDEEMMELNERFRGDRVVTDVLSFPNEGFAHEAIGDVAICVPQAERQAGAHGHPLEHELAILAVHGGLHLLGFDDITPAGEEEMRRFSDAVLRPMGIDGSLDWGTVHQGEPA
jgi:rRNA maturation RNase YbeY